ncbi:leucine-rich repeat protein, putative [Plasmodium relictum]|uniref:Leucine-rich repeat protein, putative n=1 Tax=Plasmodium relictum TaxID=85471 RepID=A0A1J1H9R3_PLARL|nr:leucine-rich repeat protein, putative [Plasmodium relictum]CRH00335.1 leucine-rich repeat protein, putative [Plasmodium relictum]
MKTLSKNSINENIIKFSNERNYNNENVKLLNNENKNELSNNDNNNNSNDNYDKINNFLFHVKNGLTQLEKTLSGEGYAFSNLICKNKNIDNIPKEIEKYKHLKYINMSNNKISDIKNLCLLPNIIFLDISFNLIENLKGFKKKCLENCIYINISHNLIKNIEKVNLKSIIEFDLSYNNINNLNIYFSNTIKKLNLSNNCIKNLNFKNKLTNLELLDLSSNPLENLDFYEITPNLNFLKINNISTLPKDQLKSLNNFKFLEYLDMDNYFYFKDISYKEIKKIILSNTKDINLLKFNGKRI